jgi:hypothetical protein
MSRKTGKPVPKTATPAARASGMSSAQVIRIVAGLLVAVALGVLVGMQINAPSSSEAMIESLQAQDAKRDAEQIVQLTKTARDTRQVVTPVVTGLAATGEVTAAQIASWQQIMKQETQKHSETVSAGTAVNVARGALRSAIGMLTTAVETFAAAQALPAEQRKPFLDLATQQRQLAVTTWSVAATHLDQLNVDSGNGHQHVYLSTSPDGGAMTPDGSPEG